MLKNKCCLNAKKEEIMIHIKIGYCGSQIPPFAHIFHTFNNRIFQPLKSKQKAYNYDLKR